MRGLDTTSVRLRGSNSKHRTSLKLAIHPCSHEESSPIDGYLTKHLSSLLSLFGGSTLPFRLRAVAASNIFRHGLCSGLFQTLAVIRLLILVLGIFVFTIAKAKWIIFSDWVRIYRCERLPLAAFPSRGWRIG